MRSELTKEQMLIRSRQLNPCDHLFWKSRGYTGRPENYQDVLAEMGYYNKILEIRRRKEIKKRNEIEEQKLQDKERNDRRSMQLNPCHPSYWKSRGYSGRPDNWAELIGRPVPDRRSRQLNPCDQLYWKSRGYSERPKNWAELLGKPKLNRKFTKLTLGSGEDKKNASYTEQPRNQSDVLKGIDPHNTALCENALNKDDNLSDEEYYSVEE